MRFVSDDLSGAEDLSGVTIYPEAVKYRLRFFVRRFGRFPVFPDNADERLTRGAFVSYTRCGCDRRLVFAVRGSMQE